MNLGNVLGTVAGAVLPGGPLVSILVKAGAPILTDIIRGQSPGAGKVVETIADALGVEPTEKAIVEKHAAEPMDVEHAIRQVETSNPEYWAYLANADRLMHAALNPKEPWFSWAWRPLWMWLLGFLWVWRVVVVGVTGIEGIVSIADLITLTLIIAGFYMGGHTVKSVVDKWAGKAG